MNQTTATLCGPTRNPFYCFIHPWAAMWFVWGVMKLHSNYLTRRENKEETLRNAEWTAATSPQHIWRKYVKKKKKWGGKKPPKLKSWAVYILPSITMAPRIYLWTQDCYKNIHPPLSFSESIIYLSKHQTLQGHKCKLITKRGSCRMGRQLCHKEKSRINRENKFFCSCNCW